MRKERNKIKPSEVAKIQARLEKKYNEFLELPLHDELDADGKVTKRGLRTIYREDKMSLTDKRALVSAVDNLLRREMSKVLDTTTEGEQPVESDKTEE